jgi:uncharacterized membrane protein
MVLFESLNLFIRLLGWFIEYIGLFLVAGSVFVALVKLPTKQYKMEDIRKTLAQRIIFGLEFIIAGDVLLATVAVNLGEILQLGAIVLIRILLGYALRKEIGAKK